MAFLLDLLLYVLLFVFVLVSVVVALLHNLGVFYRLRHKVMQCLDDELFCCHCLHHHVTWRKRRPGVKCGPADLRTCGF